MKYLPIQLLFICCILAFAACEEGQLTECGANLVCPTNQFYNQAACQCECLDKWCGENCNIAVDTCLNGGAWNETSCMCDCPTGFTGESCETSTLQGGLVSSYSFNLLNRNVNTGNRDTLAKVVYQDFTDSPSWGPQVTAIPPEVNCNAVIDYNLIYTWQSQPPVPVGTYSIANGGINIRLFWNDTGIIRTYEGVSGTFEVEENTLSSSDTITFFGTFSGAIYDVSFLDTIWIASGEVGFRQVN